jgi:hypothetical protein
LFDRDRRGIQFLTGAPRSDRRGLPRRGGESGGEGKSDREQVRSLRHGFLRRGISSFRVRQSTASQEPRWQNRADPIAKWSLPEC